MESAADDDSPAPAGRSPSITSPAAGSSWPAARSSATTPRANARQPRVRSGWENAVALAEVTGMHLGHVAVERPRGDGDPALDGERQRQPGVVVGVLADQVHAARAASTDLGARLHDGGIPRQTCRAFCGAGVRWASDGTQGPQGLARADRDVHHRAPVARRRARRARGARARRHRRLRRGRARRLLGRDGRLDARLPRSTRRRTLLGDDPFAREDIGCRLAMRPGEQGAKMALDAALHDWLGKRLGRAGVAAARAPSPRRRPPRTRSASTRSRAPPTARAARTATRC